jgi:hypothetical protein
MGFGVVGDVGATKRYEEIKTICVFGDRDEARLYNL